MEVHEKDTKRLYRENIRICQKSTKDIAKFSDALIT
jgi:hypothetical protein